MEKQYINKLQLTRHEEVFPSREEAVNYIEDNFKPDVLIAEPAVVFYGNDRERNAILALGTGTRKVFLIDVAEIKEQISAINESVDANDNTLSQLEASVNEIITACGLDYDTNKKVNQIAYVPNSRDEIIGSSKSIAEAVAALSEFIQKNVSETSLAVDGTKTVELVYADAPKGGKVLTANVKVSEEGKDDDLLYNDNIIGVKPDGLFASVNVRYDEDTNRIIFTSSGIKDGQFKTDAKKQVIQLPNAGVVVAKNSDESPVKVQVKKNDEGKTKISADVKISDDQSNILKIQDGSLLVDGRAKNIAYKNTTVFSGLNNLEKAIDEINEKLDINEKNLVIEGIATDSTTVNVKAQTNGGFILSSDVKLSTDNSLKITDGGLSVNVTASCDTENRVLTIMVGDREIKVQLPQVDIHNIIQDIYYDASTKVIHIVINGSASDLLIPIGDVLVNWGVENDPTSPVVLTKIAASEAGGSDKLSATLKIATSGDNILEVDGNGNLMVPRSVVDNAVAAESNRAQEAEKVLSDKQNVIDGTIAQVNSDIANVNNSLTAVNAAIEAEVSRAKAKEEVIEGNVTRVENGLSAEIARATAKEDLIDGKVQGNSDAIQAEVTRATIEETKISGQVSINTDAISTLNGGAETPGSVREIVKSAVDLVDGKVTNETERATGVEQSLQEQINAINAASPESVADALQKAKDYTDQAFIVPKIDIENNQKAIEEIKQKNNEQDEAIKSKVSNVEVRKNGASDFQYTLYVDGVPAGDIDIPQDALLQEAKYNPATKHLEFVFANQAGTASIDISDLVDTYVAGDGLEEVESNKFNIKINTNADEGYLFVDASGICVKGINAKLDAKANLSDVYSKEEADRIFLKEHQDISGLATKEEVASVKDTADANKKAIEVLNGNESQDGSLLNAVRSLKDEITSKVADEKTAREIADNELQGKIDTKAGKDDVYTKAEIDAKHYLTEHQDITGKADKADLESVKTTANANKEAIAELTSDVNNMKFEVADSNGVHLAMQSVPGANNKLTAEVKTSANDGNIIRVNSDGLFARAEFSYDPATNAITFNNGISSNTYNLNSNSLVKSMKYDADTNEIVMVTVVNGEEREFRISASAFVKMLSVSNADDSCVSLKIENGPDGQTLSATLRISAEDGNAVVANNGTLYVSKRAADMTAIGKSGERESLQAVITGLLDDSKNLAALQEKVGNIETKVDGIDSTVKDMQYELNTVKGKVEDMGDVKIQFVEVNNKLEQVSAKADSASEKANNTESRLNTLEPRVSAVESDLTTVKASVSSLESKISSVETKADAAQTTANQAQIGLTQLSTTVQGIQTDVLGLKTDISGKADKSDLNEIRATADAAKKAIDELSFDMGTY